MEELNDIDSIVASAEASTNQEIPMEGTAPEVEAAPPQPTEYEFEYEGRQIKAPVEKILKWASMGYGAPNRIGELSKKISDYDGKFKQYEQYDKVYKPIDEWAKSNPDKWQSLVSGWQQAQYGVLPNQTTPEQVQQTSQLPPEVIQKLQEFDNRFQQQDQEKTVLRQKEADQGLDGEIQSIRKQFSNLDFDAPDERGNSLELQILEHATKNGIPSYRAAFRDYCFDKLNSFSENKGRENASKAVSPKTKAGLLGKDQAPSRSRSAPDLRGRNYDQIHQMVLEELGISAG